jgi:hypothetical protein
LPFGLKNAPAKFSKVMDWVLVGLNFAKCYIDDIIVFNPTSKDQNIICRRYLEDLKIITLNFI